MPKIFALLLLIPTAAAGQTGYQKNYIFLHSANGVADKNFYLLTVIDQTPAVRQLLAGDEQLRHMYADRLALLKEHVTDTSSWAATMVAAFEFSPADSAEVTAALSTLYRA